MPETIQYVPQPPRSGFKQLLTEPVALPATGAAAAVLTVNAAGMTAALQAALQRRLNEGLPADGNPRGRLLYSVDEILPTASGSMAKVTIWYETI